MNTVLELQDQNSIKKRLSDVVFSIGSNCGDRHQNVLSGIAWLQNILEESTPSSIYTTIDCHGGKIEYMNAVVKGKTHFPFNVLDKKCKEYEIANGRTLDKKRCGKVPVDIDIVIYANEILRIKDYEQQYFQIGYKEI